MKTVDHVLISIIISIQFLASLFFLLFVFLYPGVPSPVSPFWLAYWGAGIATAVLLQKKSPMKELVGRRLAALLWNAVGMGIIIFRAKLGMNPKWPSDLTPWLSYGTTVIGYLAVTSGIGFAGKYRRSATEL